MMRHILLFIVCYVASSVTLPGAAQPMRDQWVPDSALAGQGFEMMRFVQPCDYSGQVVSTVVRKLAPGHAGRGVLYIHGFNDYFFQAEMADLFVAHGYDFFAVDLRKYGRSILPGQHLFEVRNLREYFPDIDSALMVMRSQGVDTIVMMGHSTGGLVASYYMQQMTRKSPEEVADVKCLVLNSPFLDWNLGHLECVVPAVAALGAIFPRVPISQGGSAYGESLLKSEHGEWTYRTDWKLPGSHNVDLGWVRAIDRAQRSLRKKSNRLHIPVLVLHSRRSVDGSEWTPEHNSADGVLDVKDIADYGRRLSTDVTVAAVTGGLHDLVLSAPGVRYPLYDYIFSWLDRTLRISAE